MNKLTIIGNLVRDPETRTTPNVKTVCSFTVAVNRRTRNGEQEADFFRVNAWDKLGENCQRYLARGKKVAVVGPVSVDTYKTKDGETRATMEIAAQDVEFLSAKGEETQSTNRYTAQSTQGGIPAGFSEVDDDDLPF